MVDKPLIPRPLGLSTDASPLGLIRWSASKKPKTRSWKRVRMSKRYSPNVAKKKYTVVKVDGTTPKFAGDLFSGPWQAEPIHESWRHLLSRWCNCCTILPDFFAWKKWWNLRPWGIFWSNKRLPKESQDILEPVSYDRIHSGFFLKNQLLSLKLADITPENGGLEYHSFGIAYFHGLWAERDDFFLSFKDLPPEIPSEKKRITYPLQSPALFFADLSFQAKGNWQLNMIPLWPVIQISDEDKPGLIRVIVRNYTLSMDI